MALTKVSYSMISGAVANILDFGADPTGTNDSKLAIENAIASGAATVYIPKGTFKVSAQIDCAANQIIEGAGVESIIEHTGSGTCFYISNRFVTIKNLYLRTTTGATAIEIFPDRNTTSILLCDLKIFNFLTAAIYIHEDAGHLFALYGITIQSCHIGQCGKGLWLVGNQNLNDVWVQNCDFSDNGFGGGISIHMQGTRSLRISIRDCIIQGGNVTLVQIEGGTGISLENNYFETSVGNTPRIYFKGSETIKNVFLRGNTVGTVNVIAPIQLDPTCSIDGLVAIANNGTAQGVALIATTDGSVAKIYRSYVGENVIPSSWVNILNPDPLALATPVNPTSIQIGWNRIGRVDFHATNQHAARIRGTGAVNTNDLAWYKSDNPAYYVGVGFDESTDRLVFWRNPSSITAGFFMERVSGRLGVGSLTQLPSYANNAAAIAGGLVAGMFYRTGADPDPICVVH